MSVCTSLPSESDAARRLHREALFGEELPFDYEELATVGGDREPTAERLADIAAGCQRLLDTWRRYVTFFPSMTDQGIRLTFWGPVHSAAGFLERAINPAGKPLSDRDRSFRTMSGWSEQVWQDLQFLENWWDEALKRLGWEHLCDLPARQQRWKAVNAAAIASGEPLTQDQLRECGHTTFNSLQLPEIDLAPLDAIAASLTAAVRAVESRLVDAPPAAGPLPTAASAFVQLFGPGDQPIVKGKPKRVLSVTRYKVVRALLIAGENGLTKDELPTASGHQDAVNILKRLAKMDKDWKSVIQLAGQTGGRYRIR